MTKQYTLTNILNHSFEKDAHGVHHVIRTRHTGAAKTALNSQKLYEALDALHDYVEAVYADTYPAHLCEQATAALGACKVVLSADIETEV